MTYLRNNNIIIGSIFLFCIFAIALVNPSVAQESTTILNSSHDPAILRNVSQIDSPAGTVTHRYPSGIVMGNISPDRLNNFSRIKNNLDNNVSNRTMYLFSWDDIPGNDTRRLINILRNMFRVDWVETAIIEKIDDGMTIKVSTGNNSLLLKLNDDKTRLNLTINDFRTDEFIVRMNNNSKLKIYKNFMSKPAQAGFSSRNASTNIDQLPRAYNTAASTTPVHNINKNTNYVTIQAAIDNASAGDEIHVDSGTYYENVNVNKKLTLRGIGMPVVDASWNGNAITLAVDGIRLEGFTVTGAGYDSGAGIKVMSNNNTLIGNNAYRNSIYSVGIYLSSSSDNKLIDNFANSIICYDDPQWCIGGTGILLTSSNNNTLIGNNVDNNREGIILSDSSNNTLISNNANDNYFYDSPNYCQGAGIILDSSSNNKLNSNNANSSCRFGIVLYSSSDNMLKDNNANGNSGMDYAVGISLWSSSNNTLSGNTANGNFGSGIDLSSSNNNTLSGNNANWNFDEWGYIEFIGIRLSSSSKNKIYHNNLINNTNQSYDDSNNNLWDNGYPSGGNYWSDYKGTDSNKDGIGDTPYSISGGAGAKDRYPLMAQIITGPVHNINKGLDYLTIQAAINDANPGNEIHVDSGTYYENVIVNKKLILHGIGMPVVDARGSGSAITLSADGITLEGFTAKGAGSNPEAGIKVRSNNNTLRGNNASNNNNGIYLWSSINNTLINNNASSNTLGIYLNFSNFNNITSNNISNSTSIGIKVYDTSTNNTIRGNKVTNGNSGMFFIYAFNTTASNNIMENNSFNFGVGGDLTSHFDGNNIDTTNLANGRPIYYVKNGKNTIYGSSTKASTFYCILCNNVTVKDMEMSNMDRGVYFWSTSNSRIQNITVKQSGWGIFLRNSSNNSIKDSKFSTNNPQDYSERGVTIYSSNDNTLINNTFISNNYGLELFSSSKNTIYNNYFNNTNNFLFTGTINVNTWNTTKKPGKNIIGGSDLGGNFWAHPNGTGFSPECDDDNNDGICDLNYILNSKNIDYLPLAPLTNLIINPGFESGKTPWMAYPATSLLFSTVPPGTEGTYSAKLSFSSVPLGIQLYQPNIKTIEPNMRYRLSFAAYSTTGHDVSVKLKKTLSPYTSYGLDSVIDLGTAWQEYSVEFKTTVTTNVTDACLQFYLYPYAKVGDIYYIDDVRLEKVSSTPVAPAITTHPAAQTVTSGQVATFSVTATGSTPLTYQWQKNNVNIAGAVGPMYTTPATILSDNGSTYRVLVTNSAGSAMSNAAILTVNPASSTNLIINPGFESGKTPWMAYPATSLLFSTVSPGSEGTYSAKLAFSSVPLGTQLYQPNIKTIEPNTRYRLSFAAYSTTGHDVSVKLKKTLSPYTSYGLDSVIDLSTIWKEYSVEFNTTITSSVNDGCLQFYLYPYAKVGDIYYIDSVVLEKIS